MWWLNEETNLVPCKGYYQDEGALAEYEMTKKVGKKAVIIRNNWRERLLGKILIQNEGRECRYVFDKAR